MTTSSSSPVRPSRIADSELRTLHWYTPDKLELLVESAGTFGPDDAALILLGGDAGLHSAR